MTSPFTVLQSQRLINEIVNTAYNAIKADFDSFILKAECRIEGGYVGTRLTLLKNGTKIDASGLVGEFSDFNLIESLCKLMKDENGNSWTSFVLTYEKGGQANIKYDYNPLPEE